MIILKVITYMQESLQITITLTVGSFYIFLQSAVGKLLAWLRIGPTILYHSSQSVDFDHLAMVILIYIIVNGGGFETLFGKKG